MKDGQNMETRYFKYYRNSIIGKVPDQVSYGVYWKPIGDEIGQVATIYLSADGIYNQINQIGRAPSELQSLMRNSYAVFCWKTKTRRKETRLPSQSHAPMI